MIRSGRVGRARWQAPKKRRTTLPGKRWTLETSVQTPGGVLPVTENQHLRLSEGGLIRLLSNPGGLHFTGSGVAALAPVCNSVEMVDEKVSLYSVTNEITTTYHGMMISDPQSPSEGRVLCHEHRRFDAIWVELTQGVRLQSLPGKVREGPKKPHPQGKKPARKGHVSTAKLLMNRQTNSVTP